MNCTETSHLNRNTKACSRLLCRPPNSYLYIYTRFRFPSCFLYEPGRTIQPLLVLAGYLINWESALYEAYSIPLKVLPSKQYFALAPIDEDICIALAWQLSHFGEDESPLSQSRLPLRIPQYASSPYKQAPFVHRLRLDGRNQVEFTSKVRINGEAAQYDSRKHSTGLHYSTQRAEHEAVCILNQWTI